MFDWVKTNKELLKTIGLTIVITGVIAFVAGVKAQSRYQNTINQAREEAKASIVKVDVAEQGK